MQHKGQAFIGLFKISLRIRLLFASLLVVSCGNGKSNLAQRPDEVQASDKGCVAPAMTSSPDGNGLTSFSVSRNAVVCSGGNSDTTPPVITASPGAGAYGQSIQVALLESERSTIYYTTDGSTPNGNSARYTGPITISQTTDLQFYAVDVTGNFSNPVLVRYDINLNAPTILVPFVSRRVISGASVGAYTPSVDVYWQVNQDGRYRIEIGGNGIPQSGLWIADAVVQANTPMVTSILGNNFNIGANTIHIYVTNNLLPVGNTGYTTIPMPREDNVPNLIASPTGGVTYHSAQEVVLSAANETYGMAFIYYTLDGTQPDQAPDEPDATLCSTYPFRPSLGHRCAVPNQTQAQLHVEPFLKNASTSCVPNVDCDPLVTLRYYGIDQAGNTSTVITQVYNIQMRDPAISLVTPPPSKVGSAQSFTFSFSSDLDVTEWQVSLDSSTWVTTNPLRSGSGTFAAAAVINVPSIPGSLLKSNQWNSIYIKARTSVGRVGNYVTQIVRDDVAPTATMNPPGGMYDATFTGARVAVTSPVDDMTGSRIYYTISNGPVAQNLATLSSASAAIPFTFYVGTHIPMGATTTINYFVADEAGNMTAPRSETFVTDPNAALMLATNVAPGTNGDLLLNYEQSGFVTYCNPSAKDLNYRVLLVDVARGSCGDAGYLSDLNQPTQSFGTIVKPGNLAAQGGCDNIIIPEIMARGALDAGKGGAISLAVDTNGSVTGVNLVSPGDGYNSGVEVSVSGCTPDIRLNVLGGRIQSSGHAVVNPGMGCPANPVVTLKQSTVKLCGYSKPSDNSSGWSATTVNVTRDKELPTITRLDYNTNDLQNLFVAQNGRSNYIFRFSATKQDATLFGTYKFGEVSCTPAPNPLGLNPPPVNPITTVYSTGVVAFDGTLITVSVAANQLPVTTDESTVTCLGIDVKDRYGNQNGWRGDASGFAGSVDTGWVKRKDLVPALAIASPIVTTSTVCTATAPGPICTVDASLPSCVTARQGSMIFWEWNCDPNCKYSTMLPSGNYPSGYYNPNGPATCVSTRTDTTVTPSVTCTADNCQVKMTASDVPTGRFLDCSGGGSECRVAASTVSAAIPGTTPLLKVTSSTENTSDYAFLHSYLSQGLSAEVFTVGNSASLWFTQRGAKLSGGINTFFGNTTKNGQGIEFSFVAKAVAAASMPLINWHVSKSTPFGAVDFGTYLAPDVYLDNPVQDCSSGLCVPVYELFAYAFTQKFYQGYPQTGIANVTWNLANPATFNWTTASIKTHAYTGPKVFSYTNKYGVRVNALITCSANNNACQLQSQF